MAPNKIIKEYPFEFYDVQFLLYKTAQNELLIPIRHTCEILGLHPAIEIRFIKNDEVLNEGLVKVVLPSGLGNEHTGDEEITCLAVRYFPYWLAILPVSRINQKTRENIARYQRDAMEKFWLGNLHRILPYALDVDLGAGTIKPRSLSK